MSTPIDFTPTPHDTSLDNADAQDAFGQVAATTDANFAKINTYVDGNLVNAYAKANQTAVLIVTSGTPGVWTDFSAGNWPTLSIVVPMRVRYLMIGIGAAVEIYSHTGNMVAVRGLIGGATTHTNSDSYDRILAQNERISCCKHTVIPANKLTPGGTVTVKPQYQLTIAGGSPAWQAALDGGHIWAIAFV